MSGFDWRKAENDTLAEWLRRWPAKPMGFPRVSSNLTGVVFFIFSISTQSSNNPLLRSSPLYFLQL